MARPQLRAAAVLVLICASGAAGPGAAQENAGAYLAGRTAYAQNDFAAAARYFTRALVQDTKNTDLMEQTIVAQISQNGFERAVPIARRLKSLEPDNQVANMVLLAKAVKDGDFARASKALNQEQTVGPLVDGLARAWVLVGQGKMSAALKAFDNVAAQPGLQGFGLYHKALAMAMVGDFESASALLSRDADVKVPITRRGVVAQVEMLSQLERNADAIALIDDVFGASPDSLFQSLLDRLNAGETLPFTTVRNAQDGLAEVFFSVAGVLNGEAADGYTLIYSRVAEYLRPDFVDATLLTAQILEQMELYDLATQAYDRVPREDPAFLSAELGRAEALDRAGKEEASIEVLRQLSKSYPDRPAVHRALGDAYRRQKLFEEAAQSYDKALAAYDAVEPAQWSLFFMRGIVHERLKQWDKAEADLRNALELNPDQPQVLNYLGYSLVELNRNLDEALRLIEKAVASRPDDGYITDSLGWALFRLGRYDEAVKHMERAAELLPVDPIINDHLGDTLWAVGRIREARFQWSRALSFNPEEEDAARIRRKLAVGLDAVLTEEGAKPLALANGN